MIITISGLAGSGKSTIGKALSLKLGFKYFDIGDLRKDMAAKRGMTIEEFNKLGLKESFTDVDADDFSKRLAAEKDDFVLQGRLAYYFIPQSFKIFVYAEPDVAARRIFNDHISDRTKQQKALTVDEQKRLSMERDSTDVARYRKIYGIMNFSDPKNYDLVIDNSGPETIDDQVEKIISALRLKGLVKQ